MSPQSRVPQACIPFGLRCFAAKHQTVFVPRGLKLTVNSSIDRKELIKMSNLKEKVTKSKGKSKNDNFVWTDDEVELLLNVVVSISIETITC